MKGLSVRPLLHVRELLSNSAIVANSFSSYAAAFQPALCTQHFGLLAGVRALSRCLDIQYEIAARTDPKVLPQV